MIVLVWGCGERKNGATLGRQERKENQREYDLRREVVKLTAANYSVRVTTSLLDFDFGAFINAREDRETRIDD